MKSFTKRSSYTSMKISDKDDAAIFESANNAINFIIRNGLANQFSNNICINYDFFVNAFKTDVFKNENMKAGYFIYSVFNFRSKAAIYIQEYDSEDNETFEVKSSRFMTKKEAAIIASNT